jgi:hypothetical protein
MRRIWLLAGVFFATVVAGRLSDQWLVSTYWKIRPVFRLDRGLPAIRFVADSLAAPRLSLSQRLATTQHRKCRQPSVLGAKVADRSCRE